METCISTGIEEVGNPNLSGPKLVKRFERVSREANAALAAAETFCKMESNLEFFLTT